MSWVRISQNYNMSSNYETIKLEYDLHASNMPHILWFNNILGDMIRSIYYLDEDVNPNIIYGKLSDTNVIYEELSEEKSKSLIEWFTNKNYVLVVEKYFYHIRNCT